ncbi:hypothetical protein Gotri_005174, partial [Gossypium trilobum]|nr:hypothetical protein [Gossypium trilobum]
MAILLLVMFTLSSAFDMSVVSYNKSHPNRSMSSWRTFDEVMAMYEDWLFADLTNEEYRFTFLGVKKPNKKVSKRSDRYVQLLGEAALPDSVDWRTKGAVAPVKDQGSC